MPWYNIKQSENKESATVTIYDQIGKNWYDDSGTVAKEFLEELEALGPLNAIELRVNSPGGSVMDGLTIFNRLVQMDAEINVYVDGQAASIASLFPLIPIAKGEGKSFMPENAIYFVHDPMNGLCGMYNADELRNLAAQLDTVKSSIMSTYIDATGKSEQEISDLMSNETTMTGKEAVEYGFATDLATPLSTVNSFNKELINSQLKAAAEKLKTEAGDDQPAEPTSPEESDASEETDAPCEPNSPEPDTPDPTPPVNVAAEILNLCAKAKCDFLAHKMVTDNFSIEQAKDRLSEAQNIKSLLAAQNMQQHESEIINLIHDPVAMLRAALVNHAAALDVDIDGNHSGVVSNQGGAKINRKEIFNKRKAKAL